MKEFDFLKQFCPTLKQNQAVKWGPGDDAAVLHPVSDDMVVSCDAYVEGVHFESSTDFYQVGEKAALASLSDLAAMGAQPMAAVAAVAMSSQHAPHLTRLGEGLAEALQRHECSLVGGDLSRADYVMVAVTVWGRCVHPPVSRHGAQLNDRLWVSGPLGGAGLGRHLTPQPRLQLGQQMAELGAHAMIDLSDGLHSDLRHLFPDQSAYGARIIINQIPVHDDVQRLDDPDQQPPWVHACCDGEDFELLMALDPQIDGREFDLIEIGQVVSTPGVRYQDVEGHLVDSSTMKGYEHFL